MELGMGSISEHLPPDISQEDLEKLIKKLNRSKKVHGILVQLPLPGHLNEERVLQLINIEKDVDGFSPINIGRLAQKGREPLFVPCTPLDVSFCSNNPVSRSKGSNAVVIVARISLACRLPCC
jgi:5,10-methylene-tetrahydrofolate dehydrogenase/methenyl tetrahydrofolate cyclohydrolase